MLSNYKWSSAGVREGKPDGGSGMRRGETPQGQGPNLGTGEAQWPWRTLRVGWAGRRLGGAGRKEEPAVHVHMCVPACVSSRAPACGGP